MKIISKIFIVIVIIGIGSHILGYDDAISHFLTTLSGLFDYIVTLPVIDNIVNDFPDYTVSSLATIAVVILGISYAIIHFVESLINGIASLLGRKQIPFKSKNKVKIMFHSAIIVKILLLTFKVVIIVTKAWSLSQFFHWLIGDPVNVWYLIKNDVLFFVVLTIIVLISLYNRQTKKQYKPA